MSIADKKKDKKKGKNNKSYRKIFETMWLVQINAADSIKP